MNIFEPSVIKYILLLWLLLNFIDIVDGKSLVSRVRYNDKKSGEVVIHPDIEHGMRLKYVILLTIFGGFFMSCALICICCSCFIFIGILKTSCYDSKPKGEIINFKNDEEEDDDLDNFSSKKTNKKYCY